MNDCNDLSLFLLWFDKEAYEPKILIFPIPPSVQCADNTCIKHFRNSYRCSASAKTKLKLSSIAEAHAKAAMILVIWIDKKIICSNLLKLVSKTILSKRQFSKDSQKETFFNQSSDKEIPKLSLLCEKHAQSKNWCSNESWAMIRNQAVMSNYQCLAKLPYRDQ